MGLAVWAGQAWRPTKWNGLEVVAENVGRESPTGQGECVDHRGGRLGIGVEATVFGLQVVCEELEAPHPGVDFRDWARRPWVLASRLRLVGG